MFGIVVYKHVVRDGQHVAVNVDGRRYNNLQEEGNMSSKVNAEPLTIRSMIQFPRGLDRLSVFSIFHFLLRTSS